jgi:AraC-like DNA-binding protein
LGFARLVEHARLPHFGWEEANAAAQKKGHDMQDPTSLIDNLSHSQLYQDYERAFGEAVGLPVALRPLEAWKLPYHGKPGEAPLTALLAGSCRACASLLQTQQQLAEQSANGHPASVTDEIGLCETAVPVRVGSQVIGLLQTGQVFRRRPTKTQFNHFVHLAERWGVTADSKALESAFFSTRVMGKRQHDSAIQLLSIFAQHLEMASNELALAHPEAEPPFVARATAFIRSHLQQNLSLGLVAKAANMSKFTFCKQFRKAIGINFVEYVARTRVEAAKNLLLNPNLRVNEIAYEVGFRSLTHFNRIFRRIVGQSPSQYREQLPAAA